MCYERVRATDEAARAAYEGFGAVAEASERRDGGSERATRVGALRRGKGGRRRAIGGAQGLGVHGRAPLLIGGPAWVGKGTELARAGELLKPDRLAVLVQIDRFENMRRLTPDRMLLLIVHQLYEAMNVGVQQKLPDVVQPARRTSRFAQFAQVRADRFPAAPGPPMRSQRNLST